MPELPEVQAHAERLTEQFRGRSLTRFVPFNFTALKTAVPAPDAAYGLPLVEVGRRGKYLLLRFQPVTFVVHLMQGGRLLVDDKQSLKPRNGQARFVFDDGPHVVLGPLKGNVGSQNYPIPDNVDVKDYSAVSIWCARFHVSFGAAELKPAT